MQRTPLEKATLVAGTLAPKDRSRVYSIGGAAFFWTSAAGALSHALAKPEFATYDGAHKITLGEENP
jgi:hypothetical protein